MDIRTILTKSQPDTDIEKLFVSATSRKKDLSNLTEECKAKLVIYEEIMQKKQSLLQQYLELKQKFENLSQGIFSSLQKEYQQEKAFTHPQNDQKIETPSKKTHHDRNNVHYNGHHGHTKHIRKGDKRRK